MAKGKSALALALKKKIGSNDEIQKVTHWIDTGFPPLNKAISGRYDGGFPCGRIVEVFGPQVQENVPCNSSDDLRSKTRWSGGIPRS